MNSMPTDVASVTSFSQIVRWPILTSIHFCRVKRSNGSVRCLGGVFCRLMTGTRVVSKSLELAKIACLDSSQNWMNGVADFSLARTDDSSRLQRAVSCLLGLH